jgi:hypothetical protein
MRIIGMLLALGACTTIDTQQGYLSVDATEGYIILGDPIQGSHLGITMTVTGPLAPSTMTAVASVSYQYEPIANDIAVTTGDQVWADGAQIYAFGAAPLPAVLADYCNHVIDLQIQVTGTMSDGHVEGSGGGVGTVVNCN